MKQNITVTNLHLSVNSYSRIRNLGNYCWNLEYLEKKLEH